MGRKQIIIIRNYDNEGNLISKECSCCHEVKLVSEFHKHKTKIDGLRLRCKECLKKYIQENKESKREYDKKRYQENKDKINEKMKEHYSKNTQEALQQIKIELESNPRKYNYIEGKEIFGIIYLVHNIKSNRYYVGQTTIGFDNRYPKGWLFTHGHKNTVKEDLELYGEDSFEYTKIFKVTYSQYELDKL